MHYEYMLSESVSTGDSRKEKEAAGCLKRGMPQPPRELETEKIFFYFSRLQPIDKSRFEKIISPPAGLARRLWANVSNSRGPCPARLVPSEKEIPFREIQ
jgi:hypothetical protein